jgi:hypothetical protein
MNRLTGRTDARLDPPIGQRTRNPVAEALMVLCPDPLTIAVTAAASAWRSITAQTILIRSTFDTCRTDLIEGSQQLWVQLLTHAPQQNTAIRCIA